MEEKVKRKLISLSGFTGGSFQEVHSGLDCEQSMSGLLPGHSYKLRVACVSDGGTSEVFQIIATFFFFPLLFTSETYTFATDLK